MSMQVSVVAVSPRNRQPERKRQALHIPRGNGNDAVPTWDTLDKAAITNERSAREFAQRITPQPPGLRPVPHHEARSRDDLQNVINLANVVEDRTPQEQASLERLQRSLERSIDRTLGRDGRER
jgi:hypothetical protein